jgi:hypothetical protein
MLKIVTIAVVGVLTVITLKRMMDQLRLQKSPVKAQTPRDTRTMTRLRQDPVTGVYYPEQ